MIEDRIGREVFGHFAEAGLEAGLAARAADAGFGVADDAGCAVDDAGFEQRPDGQVGGRGIAAGVGDQARAGDALAAEFGQSVDGFGQQCRLGVSALYQVLVALGGAQAEGAAEVDDAHPGGEQPGRQFHGNFGRRGEEDDVELRIADGFGSAGKLAASWAGDDGGAPAPGSSRCSSRTGPRWGDVRRMGTSSAPL